MITFLNGTIVDKQPTRVVIDVGGVGYEVLIPLSSFDRLPARNATCRILTYEHIREDLHQLFGFMTDAERDLFVLLMGTPGIGPKLALSALSSLSVREIRLAIAGGDSKRLTSISGVGRKLAERMIVDLRDKISEADVLEAAAGADPATLSDRRLRDALLALVALGYTEAQARKMAADVISRDKDKTLGVEEIIRHALSS